MELTVTVIYKIKVHDFTGKRPIPAKWKREAMARIKSGVDLSNYNLGHPYHAILGRHPSFYFADFSIKSIKMK